MYVILQKRAVFNLVTAQNYSKKEKEKSSAGKQTQKRKETDERNNATKRQQPEISEENFLQEMKEQVIKNFELAMKYINHKYCTCCKMVSLTIEMSVLPNICKKVSQ